MCPKPIPLILQEGNLIEALLKAEEFSKLFPTCRSSGSTCPAAVCLIMQAKAHSQGGSPLNALPPALSAVAMCESHSLYSLRAMATTRIGTHAKPKARYCALDF